MSKFSKLMFILKMRLALLLSRFRKPKQNDFHFIYEEDEK